MCKKCREFTRFGQCFPYDHVDNDDDYEDLDDSSTVMIIEDGNKYTSNTIQPDVNSLFLSILMKCHGKEKKQRK